MLVCSAWAAPGPTFPLAPSIPSIPSFYQAVEVEQGTGLSREQETDVLAALAALPEDRRNKAAFRNIHARQAVVGEGERPVATSQH